MRENVVRIKPFDLLDLIAYTGVKQENQHGFVTFSGRISEELEQVYIEMALEEMWSEVVAVDDSGEEKAIFCGVVTELAIKAENGVRVLTATLKTGTYLMDIMSHIRSYQTPSMPYKTILSSYTAKYPKANFIMTEGKGAVTDGLVMQYQETDWQFTKRLASHFNTVIIPVSKISGVKYFFGLPDPLQPVEIKTGTYQMQKKVDEFAYKKKNGLQGARERDTIYYVLTSREIYDLGDCVSLNERELYISKIESSLVGNELFHTYYMKIKAGFKVPEEYNLTMIGASLNAVIAAVQKDVVQVKIAEDENSQSGVTWFPYSSVYSSPDGTGWYCMPEIGDTVRLYLPNEKEAQAYVISATHLQATGGNSRSNPDYKSFMNKYGKEVLFAPASLTFTNNSGLSIQLIDNEGIKILSNGSITMEAEEDINITSVTSTMDFIAPKKINIERKDASVAMDENINISGGQIKLD